MSVLSLEKEDGKNNKMFWGLWTLEYLCYNFHSKPFQLSCSKLRVFDYDMHELLSQPFLTSECY